MTFDEMRQLRNYIEHCRITVEGVCVSIWRRADYYGICVEVHIFPDLIIPFAMSYEDAKQGFLSTFNIHEDE